MTDPRLFEVLVNDKVVGTYPVKEAREIATPLRFKQNANSVIKIVRLRNAQTGDVFKWWPELGGLPKDQGRILDRNFMVRMLHN